MRSQQDLTTPVGSATAQQHFSFNPLGDTSPNHPMRPALTSRPHLTGFSPNHRAALIPMDLQGVTPETGTMRKLRCNCRNTHCLKLYCDCFNGGVTCDEELCNCVACHNNLAHDDIRSEAISVILQRNPNAFKSKIVGSAESLTPGNITSGGAVHHKGCHCKKSNCLKRYCECFTEGVYCSVKCRCQECKNFEGSEDRHAARLLDSANSPMKRRKITSNGSPISTMKGFSPFDQTNYSPVRRDSPLLYVSPQRASPGHGHYYTNGNGFSPGGSTLLGNHPSNTIRAALSPFHASSSRGSGAPRFSKTTPLQQRMDYLDGLLTRSEVEALCHQMLVAAQKEVELRKSKEDNESIKNPSTSEEKNAVGSEPSEKEKTKDPSTSTTRESEGSVSKEKQSSDDTSIDDPLMCTEEETDNGDGEGKDTAKDMVSSEGKGSALRELEERAVLQHLSVALRRLATEAAQRRRHQQPGAATTAAAR